MRLGRQGASANVVATGVDDFVVNEMLLSKFVDRVSQYEANGSDGEPVVARRLFLLMRGNEPSTLALEWPVQFFEKN